MSEPIELPHIDRIDYVGGSYPMAIKPGGEYVDYDDHVAIVRQLAEQRAELLEALRQIAALPAHPMRKKGVEIAESAIANATQQRKEPGA